MNLIGHYYSPIPNRNYIRENESRIFSYERLIPGVDLNDAEQLALLERFFQYYGEIPFEENKNNHHRYFFNNTFYSYSDAVFLYSVIRHFKPKKIIEIGSGFSSALILDVNEIFFTNKINCTFIEPFSQRLLSLRKDGEQIKIIESFLQDVDLELFSTLTENDILFIDSSHVAKIGSDVNRIYFEIFPILKPGVLIHIHDIFFPFEYPKKWIFGGRAWNEAYLLKAFLQYNYEYRIICFNTYLEEFYKSFFMDKMPLCLKNRGGSIWLKKHEMATIGSS
jgi:predicted O-methyltransferase YrrM